MKKAIAILLTALLLLTVFVSCEGDVEDMFGKTVSFNGNGSTSGQMAEMKVKKGEEVTLPANEFTRTDYVFAGWNTQADGSGTGYADKAKASFDDNTVLYAQWIEEVTITFDGNGSTDGEMAALEVKKGEDFKLTKNAFEKTNYIFTGWNTAADGSGTAYANEGTAKFDKDTTLYAQWIEELTITFNANDGSETPETKTQKVGKGVETALDENTFELSGFTFTKWNNEKDGSGTDYANGAVKTFDSDLELYAQWAANTDTPYVVNHYTKNLSDDKYTLSSTDNKTDTTGVLLVLENLKKTIEGFTYDEGFAGTETKGTTKPSSGAVTEAAVLGEGNLVIDLYYSRDSHTVALTKGDNISAITGAGTYAYGASVSVEATIDSGYKLANWIVTGETTEVSTDNPYVFTMGASDVAYTANATPISYTVTFNKNNESATGTMADQSFTYDVAQNLTTNTYSWASHSFTGWNTSADGQGTSYADGASVSNLSATDGATVTLYAQWSEGAVVTFHKNDGVTPESTATQLIQFNIETALTKNSFSRDTYIFLGWNTAKDGKGTAYSDEQKVTLTANLDLYAQWAIDLATTTLSKTSWTNGNVYSMSDNVPISDRITVTGSVTLILPAGKTLTASKGITVTGTNSLTINGEGTLTATASSSGRAGIGGDSSNISGGTVTINGGTVNATGGGDAAGIGGGYEGAGGEVTIKGGSVTATGGNNAAGIGGGSFGVGGTISISGGTVTANGGNNAAGIGAGAHSSSHGTLKIGTGYVLTGGSASADTLLLGPVDSETTYTGAHPQYMNASAVSEIKDSTSAITLKSGVYTTDKNDTEVVVSERITVEGSVFLLLPDGKTLTASKGITVSEGNTLVIDKYGSTATGTGTLNATGADWAAGIGGGEDGAGGTVTINGGTVTANGASYAAGIGGGEGGAGGTVIINGGKVTAIGGSQAAGIGGGDTCAGGTVTINGGTVTANGGPYAAGIGGGYHGAGGTISITGGTVTATGGKWAAGIGGGQSRAGGTISISGGTVTANGGEDAVGIGAGNGSSDHGDLTIADDVIMMVSTNNTDWSVYDGSARTQYMKVPEPIVLTSSTTAWTGGNVYTLGDEDVTTIGNRITVTGSVGLILPKDKTLTASAGITVNSGNSLTIGGSGELFATGTTVNAGIGGGGESGGTITITGGNITADGGDGNGAGIGGGLNGDGGKISISGGTVTANGGNLAAGIGGGCYGAGGEISISGGTVTANGGNLAVGIGRGYDGGSDGTLKIGTGMALYGDSTSPAQTKRSDATESYTGDRYRYMLAKQPGE